jgi:hypothetical protein
LSARPASADTGTRKPNFELVRRYKHRNDTGVRIVCGELRSRG